MTRINYYVNNAEYIGTERQTIKDAKASAKALITLSAGKITSVQLRHADTQRIISEVHA